MNVVDSLGWLEYFANAPNAEFFAACIQDLEQLVVPTPSMFEVIKRIGVQRGEGYALRQSGFLYAESYPPLRRNYLLAHQLSNRLDKG